MTPLILVINDDGIFSKGIKSLVEAVEEFGKVVVVAPDKPQSGMGHAITVSNVLRLNRSDLFPNHEAYTCSGTPVDCVKLGIYEILKQKPDLLVSGINHGENTSTNVLYSGTMSAAVEGAMEGIPSIGFSLCDFGADADFTERFVGMPGTVGKVVAEKLELTLELPALFMALTLNEYLVAGFRPTTFKVVRLLASLEITFQLLPAPDCSTT